METLPYELIDIIISDLDIHSKAALALSCACFYKNSYLNAILRLYSAFNKCIREVKRIFYDINYVSTRLFNNKLVIYEYRPRIKKLYVHSPSKTRVAPINGANIAPKDVILCCNKSEYCIFLCAPRNKQYFWAHIGP